MDTYDIQEIFQVKCELNTLKMTDGKYNDQEEIKHTRLRKSRGLNE